MYLSLLSYLIPFAKSIEKCEPSCPAPIHNTNLIAGRPFHPSEEELVNVRILGRFPLHPDADLTSPVHTAAAVRIHAHLVRATQATRPDRDLVRIPAIEKTENEVHPRFPK